VSGAWKPWRALRARDDIDFALVDLPAGLRAVLARKGHDRVILIDRSLEPSERLAALAHELVHDERGGAGRTPPPPHPLSVAARREEARVDRIVTDRLVPPTELARFLEARADVDPPVRPWEVAEEFGVPQEYAERALRLFVERRSA
jgi:hypothetical protein